MRHMKKLALSLAAITALTTACVAPNSATTAAPTSAAKEETKAEATTEAASGETQAAASGEAEELTIWAWDQNFNIPIMETAAEYYRKAGHENFKLNIVEVEENAVETKSITAFTSGVSEGMPDILLMGDYSAQSFLNNYEGKYADLTDAMDFSQFAPYKVKAYTVNDRVYGVPFDSGSAGIYYRKDYLEQAGFSEDDMKDLTWSQFVEIGKKVKEATGKYFVVFTPYKGTHYMQIALQSAGQWLTDSEGKPVFKDSPAIREMMEVIKEMYKADLIMPVDYWSAEGVGGIQKGDVAAHISAVWYIPTITSVADMEGKWGYTNIPKLETVDNATQYSNIGGSSWVVLEDSKNKDLAIDFLKTVYAGNVDFYQQILKEQGAVATYIPSQSGEAYGEGVDYFGGACIYKDFAEWGSKVPEVDYGMYTNEACDALRTVTQDYFDDKMSLDDALTKAEENFNMQVGN